MESGSLLKPMAADALLRRPQPQAAAPVKQVTFREAEKDSPFFHAPAFAPKPEKKAEPTQELDALLSDFLADEDEEEPLEDAVPTERMPVPVCVPLYEGFSPKKRSLWWLFPVLVLLLGAAGYAAWKYDVLPVEWILQWISR